MYYAPAPPSPAPGGCSGYAPQPGGYVLSPAPPLGSAGIVPAAPMASYGCLAHQGPPTGSGNRGPPTPTATPGSNQPPPRAGGPAPPGPAPPGPALPSQPRGNHQTFGSSAALSNSGQNGFVDPEDADDADGELKELYEQIDVDHSGSISMLEFAAAMQTNKKASKLVLPEGVDGGRVMSDEAVFDAVSEAFEAISGGGGRIDWQHFREHIKGSKKRDGGGDMQDRLKVIFDAIDKEKHGTISRLQLVTAVQTDKRVNELMLPGVDSSNALSDQDVFDAVHAVFDAIAGGKKRIDFIDFYAYFRKVAGISAAPLRPGAQSERRGKRLFIIGQGFGRQLNPRQAQVVVEAGFQIQWSPELPNPEVPGFHMNQYLGQLKAAIDDYQPDCVASASKGDAYVTALWSAGLWTGPTLMINAHPSIGQIPKNMSVVLAHGSNDEVYPLSRAYLEQLISTASENRRLLYWSGNSGQMQTGQITRPGDKHNMESLLIYDTLPRLFDAVLSNECPEVNLVRSWRDRLADHRLEAEAWLGYSLEKLRRFWCSSGRRGKDSRKLFEVPHNSEEFEKVLTTFRAAPNEQAAYCGTNYAAWEARQVVSIERIENGFQEDGSAVPYRESLKKSIRDQGLTFEPGVHTSWAFHGTDAIDSIISNPITGFQPLASGTRGASLWGSGTYFARDAKYVAEGGFCHPGPDGTCRMLMCLLTIGMPCLGDPNHHGVLPLRQGNHRYNSSVDSLSNPEIFIVTHPGAAHPAYLITFL